MAKHEVPDNEIGVYAQKLTAATVDEVDFFDTIPAVEVLSDGSAKLYFTTDGSVPTVGGSNCHELPQISGGVPVRTVLVSRKGTERVPTVIKLTSAGTPEYSVSRAEVQG